MKILVTGFAPFGQETLNPSWEAVQMLPDEIAGAKLYKRELPVSFAGARYALEEAIEELHPDVVLSVGQAGGRSCVTVEQTAVNLADARIPDNDGAQPRGVSLCPDAPDAYFATIPVAEAVEAVRKAGLPCHVSYTAGTYVCNAVMYHALHAAGRGPSPECAEHADVCGKVPQFCAGFVHVPYIPGQVIDKSAGTPSMALTDIAASLKAIVEVCAV